jgi:hypothetical protein
MNRVQIMMRQFVRRRMKPFPTIARDPIWEIVGLGQGSPQESLTVDDIVYRR